MFRNLIRLLNSKNYKYRNILLQNRTFNNFSKPEHNPKCSCLFNYDIKRNIHTTINKNAKIYVDRENTYLYTFIQPSLPDQINNLKVNITTNQIDNQADFDAFLTQNWRKKTPEEIVSAFNSVKDYCSYNNIAVSNEIFNNLTDGLLDHIETLTDKQLLFMLDILLEFPPCDSFKSHNFHDIWSALDDVCCWRMAEWDQEMFFIVADKWYKLGLGKVCDFIYEILQKSSKRATKLSKTQLLQAFFFMNVCRKQAIAFEYENAAQNIMEDLTVDEMAIIALGYFKTQSKVKIPEILSAMMRKVKETENVHEMTLCAILKIIRFTSTPSLSDQIFDFLNHITPSLHVQSNMCIMHTALLGTTLQILHKPSLKVIGQQIAENVNDVHKVRLKDLERILLPFTMFNYDPETTPDLFKSVFNELHSVRRQREIVQYPRCLPSALLFLSIRDIYSHELLNQVLDMDFILEVYGKLSKSLPREIFSLDNSVDIECPGYKGNRLDPKMRYKAAKWLTAYTPQQDQQKRLSKADLVVLDASEMILKIVGNPDFMFTDHILPHFGKADIVLCRDKTTDKFVKPFGFENYILGDVMRPADLNNYIWYAIVVIGWNATIRNTTIPVGSMNMKMRQLEKIGYQPIPIIWNEYMPLAYNEKIDYITCKLGTKNNRNVL